MLISLLLLLLLLAGGKVRGMTLGGKTPCFPTACHLWIMGVAQCTTMESMAGVKCQLWIKTREEMHSGSTP